MGGGTSPVVRQEAFRFRVGDSVGINSTTWDYAQAVDVTLEPDNVLRIRILISDTVASTKTSNYTSIVLQYEKNSTGGFANITGTTPIQTSASGQFTDGDAITTAQITGGQNSFVNGEGDTNNAISNITLGNGNDHTVLEFCLTIDSAQVADGDTIDLQLAGLDTTANDIPRITVSIPVVIACQAGTIASSGQSATISILNEFILSASANIPAGGASTTAQLDPPSGKTTGDFVAGRIQDDENPADAVDITNNDYSEFEWAIEPTSASVDLQEYEFRITLNGSPLDTYTVTPKLTVTSGIIISCQAGTIASSGQSATVSSGAGNITISCQPATIASSGQSTTIVPGGVTVSSGAPATIASSGQSTTVSTATTISCQPATITFSGQTATIIPGSVTVTSGAPATIASTGQTATIVPGGITVTSGAPATIASTGQSATVTTATTVNCQPATIASTGQIATVDAPITIACQPATITFSGQTATVDAPITIACQPATVASAGQSATIEIGATTISCQPATVASAGQSATVVPGSVTVSSGAPATITSAGQSATITTVTTISCQPATITSTGQSATVVPGGVSIACVNASLTMAGQSATVQTTAGNITIACSAGSLAIAGQGAGIFTDQVVSCGFATASLGGQSTTVLPGGVTVSTNTGDIVATALSATLQSEVFVLAGPATLTVVGNSAGVQPGPVSIAVSSGTISIAGMNINVILVTVFLMLPIEAKIIDQLDVDAKVQDRMDVLAKVIDEVNLEAK